MEPTSVRKISWLMASGPGRLNPLVLDEGAQRLDLDATGSADTDEGQSALPHCPGTAWTTSWGYLSHALEC
jgi:hypothetical protein